MQTLGRKSVTSGRRRDRWKEVIFSVVSSNQQQQPSLHLVLNPAKEDIIVTQTSQYLGSRQQKKDIGQQSAKLSTYIFRGVAYFAY